MREVVDPALLPRFLGGDVADQDFMPTRVACADAAGEELNVAAGKSDERGLPLEEGQVASYGFSVDGDMDVMFSCRFDVDGGESQELREPERVQEVSGGTFKATRRGRLVLVFDNSYSWVYSKTIHFECAQLPSAIAEAVSSEVDVRPAVEPS